MEPISSERQFARVIDLSGTDQFRRLVSMFVDGIVVTDRVGRVMLVNLAAEELLRSKGRDLIGRPFPYPLDVGRLSEVEIARNDGTRGVVEVRVGEIEWDGLNALVASLRDVTGRVEMVEQQSKTIGRLQELDDLKNEFVSIVSHDLRSPMATIAGFADTLRYNWDAFEDQRKIEILARISRSTNQLSKLVENVLQVSQIESGRLSYDIGEIDLRALIDRVVEENTRLVPGNGAARAITARVPEDLPKVRADETAQWQILTNLVGNALKFSFADAPVGIEATVTGGAVRVAVTDAGVGIHHEDRSKLFQKFSRLEQPGDLKAKGSGLGLYICKAMVESQRGKIWVESEPGRGSTFMYTVPLAR